MFSPGACCRSGSFSYPSGSTGRTETLEQRGASILFDQLTDGHPYPCPLCRLPESGGFCPGPIYKLPALRGVLGNPLFPPT